MKKYKLLSGMLVILGSFLLLQTPSQAATKEEVLSQINAERERNGLSAYVLSEDFCEYADIRAKEQEKLFSHQRPDGTDWYTVSPSVNRENIAHVETKEQESNLLLAWMLSDSHRENVLSDTSTKIGIGIYTTEAGEEYIVTLTD